LGIWGGKAVAEEACPSPEGAERKKIHLESTKVGAQADTSEICCSFAFVLRCSGFGDRLHMAFYWQLLAAA